MHAKMSGCIFFFMCMRMYANSKAFSLAGGGHTIAALHELRLINKISYVSTAGGALIDFLMGKQLPDVVALEKAAAYMYL